MIHSGYHITTVMWFFIFPSYYQPKGVQPFPGLIF